MEKDSVDSRWNRSLLLCAALIGIVLYAAAADATPGYVFYQKNSSNNLYGDNWTGSDFTASLENLTDLAAQARYISAAYSSRRNETLVGIIDSSTSVRYVIYNMTGRTPQAMGRLDTAPSLNHKTVDVAYEQLSGNGLIVWDSTGNDIIARYMLWNGTGIIANSSFILPSLSSTRRFIKLYPKNDSNDIMLVYNDALSDISAILWNGTAWGNGVYAANSGRADNDQRPFDFVWKTNGDGILFYSNSSAPVGVHYRNFTYASSSWSGDANVGLTYAGTPRQIDACRNPHNDYIGVISVDTGSDAQAFMWNGNGLETSPARPTSDTGVSVSGHNSRCEWESSGNQAVFMFVDTAPASSIDYFHYNLSSNLLSRNWSTAALTSTHNTGAVGAGTVTSIKTSAEPSDDTILLTYKDNNYDVRGLRWDGVRIAAATPNFIVEAISSAGPTPSANAQSYDFIRNLYPSSPPVLTAGITDGSNSTNPQNNDTPIVFSATAVDPEGDDYFLLVCNGTAGQFGGDCYGGTVCKGSLATSGAGANCTLIADDVGQELEWFGYVCDTHGMCSGLDDSESPANINHPPFANPTLTPPAPSIGDTLACTGNAGDDDIGDFVSNTFVWWLQDEGTGIPTMIAGETGNQLSSDNFDSNDVLACEVTSTDSFGFAAPAANSSNVTVARGLLSAVSTLGNTSILRTQGTTVDVTCSIADGDGESVVAVILDNRTGVLSESSTSVAAVYANQSTLTLERIANASASGQVTVTATAAGSYQFAVQCQADDTDGSPTNSMPDVLDVLLDTTPPVISNVNIDSALTTADIRWDTDDASDTVAEYGVTPALGSSVFDPAQGTAHLAPLVNLTPSTTYYYNLTSCNADGYCASSGLGSFETASPDDQAAPNTKGYCTGTYIEKSSGTPTGKLRKGDVYEFYCELPARSYEREEIKLRVTNKEKQTQKTLTIPDPVYGTQIVLYP